MTIEIRVEDLMSSIPYGRAVPVHSTTRPSKIAHMVKTREQGIVYQRAYCGIKVLFVPRINTGSAVCKRCLKVTYQGWAWR